jgi:hypothetical protein
MSEYDKQDQQGKAAAKTLQNNINDSEYDLKKNII